MSTRRRGFTLIELLVVIAIIGILAAMLFPVFARARESARKIQCLSNVKNVAMAVQMYLADYQKFYPCLHDQAQIDYFKTAPGGGQSAPVECSGPGHACNRGPQANPFLRPPVILDEYTKNRDIWRCPSAKKAIGPAWIVPNYTNPWWKYLQENEGLWGRARRGSCNGDCGGPCGLAWPPGWGGTVTDSIAQNAAAGPGTNWAEITIALTELQEVQESQILDAVNLVVCGDSTIYTNILGVDDMVYEINSFCSTDGDHVDCGILDQSKEAEWNANPSFRDQYARHLGGGNVGFADGHAKWFSGVAMENLSPYCDCGCPTQTIVTKDRPWRGVCPVSGSAVSTP